MIRHRYWNEYGNLIRIDAFTGDPDDRELLRLMPYLLKLNTVDNIRKVEKRGWQSHYPLPVEGDDVLL